MSAPLSFTAACSQLGNAAYNVVSAAWKASFSGGKVRIITVGFPVLFVTAGTGAAVFAVMTTVLGAAYRRCRNGARSAANYFRQRTITPIYPPRERAEESQRPQRPQHPIPTGSSQRPGQSESVEEVHEPVVPAPLPPNAAEERNKALLNFLEFIDRYLIDPWVINNEKLLQKSGQTDDPSLKAFAEDKAALKSLLRAITLWQLSVQWEELEAKFVKMETPAPPTLKSIEQQLRAMGLEAGLEDRLIEPVQAEGDGRVEAFRREIDASGLPQSKKLSLMGISLQLHAVTHLAPADTDAQGAEINQIRQNFATIMHHGMATSFTQVSLMVEGWMTVIQQISSSPPATPPCAEREEPPRRAAEDSASDTVPTVIRGTVKETLAVLSGDLSSKYLEPLWKKQQEEWKESVAQGLGNERIQKKSAPHMLASKFISSESSEEAFLTSQDSHGFSTPLTANIAFFRAIQIMQKKEAPLQKTINTLPASLLAQLEPLLVGTLHKSAQAVSEIKLETAVPRVVDYAIDLLRCCEAMQKARSEADDLSDEHWIIPHDEDPGTVTPLEAALVKGSQSDHAEGIRRIELGIYDPLFTGQSVIQKLGLKAHKAVRFKHPEIQERTWIHTTKERIEGLLRVTATEYAQEPEGNWLATLLKAKPSENGGKSLIGSLLSLQNKLWTLIPGMENMTKILLMGVKTFAEESACETVQQQLNALTSTGFLSATIGTTVVKGLIVDRSKEPSKWTANLPLLQNAYAFLQPDEQESVLKHLSALCPDAQTFERCQHELVSPPPLADASLNVKIMEMKQAEATFTEPLEVLAKAYKELKADEAANQDELACLQEAYDKIKREKDLKQFERIKGLALHVADHFLDKKLAHRTGGASLKPLLLAVIHETYTLLSYQEVVKHWIFTIVDLLLDELEEATAPQAALQPLSDEEEETDISPQTPSILEYIPTEKQKILLGELCKLMDTSTEQEAKGWLNAASWIKSTAHAVTSWAPGKVWGYIEGAFKDSLRVTPRDLTGKAIEKFRAFATIPTGLSDTVIQALSEKVADPRPREVLQERRTTLERTLTTSRDTTHRAGSTPTASSSSHLPDEGTTPTAAHLTHDLARAESSSDLSDDGVNHTAHAVHTLATP